jgi:ribosomal protein S18 acetylase RimI-like enzyme
MRGSGLLSSLGFAVVGMISNYYGNEDALIMERLR